MRERIDLNVPFVEKDQAKALGARWDPSARTWFVPAGKNPQPFQKWLPRSSDELQGDDLLELEPPIFLVESMEACWRCGGPVPVATLGCLSYVGSEGDDDEMGEALHLLNSVVWLPPAAVAALRKVNPGYKKRFSKTAGMEYFMNHCACGAQLGDFFMHMEAGGAFFPQDEEAASAIKLTSFAEKAPLKVDGELGTTWPNLIWQHARRL